MRIAGCKVYWVYVLREENGGGLYVGYTGNLERRLREHRRKRGGLELLYLEGYKESGLARVREARLKAHGAVWVALKGRLGVSGKGTKGTGRGLLFPKPG